MDSTEVIIQTLILILSVALFCVLKRRLSLSKGFAGPTALPFIGNLWAITNKTAVEYLEYTTSLFNEYGSPLRLWLGPIFSVYVGDGPSIKAVLKSSNTNKPFNYDLYKLMADGVFVSNGEKWKKLRRITMTMFQSNYFEEYINVFNKKSQVMCDIIREKCHQGSFDVQQLVANYALDTICKNACGCEIDSLHNPNITFPDDLITTVKNVYNRACQFWLYPKFIYQFTVRGQTDIACSHRMDKFSLGIIQERRKALEKSKENSGDNSQFISKPFIDTTLEYCKKEKLSDLEAARIISDLIVGGSDTSEITISHCLLMLAMYDCEQDKVYSEIKEIFGDSDRPVTSKDLDRMSRLEMVINECLRHIAPPQIIRKVEKDIVLEQSTIPAGSDVYISLFALHNDKKIWSNPEEFCPERFLPENVEKRPKFCYIPFSYGPRMCPGNKYAFISTKLVISTILRSFRLTTKINYHEIEYVIGIQKIVKGGYPIEFHPR